MSRFSRIAELLYPRHCPVCDRLLSGNEPYICRDCAKNVKWIRGPVCMKCGRPLDTETGEYCDNCRRRVHVYERNLAPFSYRNEIQTSIMRFKYGGRAEYAAFYAKAIAAYGQKQFNLWKPQMIIPVPVHTKRYIHRGYNQAGVLAEQLSKVLKIPAREDLVLRTKNTRPQKGQTPIGRRQNLSGAFCLAGGARIPKRILIVDDIYTTGATMDALAGVLLDGGAEKVWAACVSIAPGRS
uniref:ComF family protein n=1 Tax=Eubacterium cellulosolvens TaxID=29322 RepID=UPI000482B0ED|nr:ComF family protein [[Eubacterium] cellulosolvens]